MNSASNIPDNYV